MGHLRTWGRWTLRAGAAGAVLSFGHAGWAQTDAAIREANTRFQEGLRLHDGGQEEEARLKFTQANAVLHTPNILFNLARSEQLTGHTLEALDHYKQYAKDPDGRITTVDRDTARQHIAELMRKVGHVAVDAPAGAKVLVDGVAVAGEAPFAEAIDVAAGFHVIEARLGDRSKSVQATPGAGETVAAKLGFDEGTTPVAAVPGPATVVTPVPAAPGGHEMPIGESPGGSGKTVTVLALAGGAAVAVGFGIGFAAATSGASSRITKDQAGIPSDSFCATNPTAQSCTDLSSALSAHKTDTALEAGFFVAGGALAVGALAVLVLWPGGSESKQTWLMPSVTRSGVTMGLGGRF